MRRGWPISVMTAVDGGEMTDPQVAFLYEPGEIESTSVEVLPDNPALFAFQVVLSGEPDRVWKRTFDQVWKDSRHLGKLDALVLTDSIRFICRESQGIEDYLFLIESRIEATNRRMEDYWNSQGRAVRRREYRPYPLGFMPIGAVAGSGMVSLCLLKPASGSLSERGLRT